MASTARALKYARGHDKHSDGRETHPSKCWNRNEFTHIRCGDFKLWERTQRETRGPQRTNPHLGMTLTCHLKYTPLLYTREREHAPVVDSLKHGSERVLKFSITNEGQQRIHVLLCLRPKPASLLSASEKAGGEGHYIATWPSRERHNPSAHNNFLSSSSRRKHILVI